MADQTTPEALYIHVPFCVRKCAYCDFYSVEPRENSWFTTYLAGLRLELQQTPSAILKTVFVGGGTPTVLPLEYLSELLAMLPERFDLSGLEEFTFESNPGVLGEPRAKLLMAAGVNRLSLGVQSLSPPTLKTLGRIHGPDEVHEAVRLVRRLGLRNLSLDLIFAVPGQTLKEWLTDLEETIRLEPEHLSIYGLSLSDETPLGRRVAGGELSAVDDDLYVEMYESARDRLLRAGYEHYEISNFARPGFRCRHNVGYWHNRPYYGLGPAACSYVGGRRWTNVASFQDYAARLKAGQSPIQHAEELDPEKSARETAMLNLRMLEGIDGREFQKLTGFDPFRLFEEPIRVYGATGLLEIEPPWIRLAPKALPVADSILADFVTQL